MATFLDFHDVVTEAKWSVCLCVGLILILAIVNWYGDRE